MLMRLLGEVNMETGSSCPFYVPLTFRDLHVQFASNSVEAGQREALVHHASTGAAECPEIASLLCQGDEVGHSKCGLPWGAAL
jgi:hypothetical protein